MKLSRMMLYTVLILLSLGLVSMVAADNGRATRSQHMDIVGVLTARPSTDAGVWIVNDQPFAVTTSTLYENGQSPAVGTCIEVIYDEAQTITFVETYPAAACEMGPVKTEYGLISAMPSGNGRIGNWTIGDVTVTSDAQTQFGRWDGAFATGVCAEVAYRTTTTDRMAHAISTTEPYHCQGGVLLNSTVGQVESMPVSLYGFWTVNGMNFAAGTSAHFAGTFAQDGCVAIDYYSGNGRFLIDSITAIDSAACAGQMPAMRGKVYGRLMADGFPQTGGVGRWRIGSDTFVATQYTHFETEAGPFAADACVHAEYVFSGGIKTLTEVETRADNRCVPSYKPEYSATGTIESMPAANRGGTWQISGMTFVVDGRTMFEETNGALAIGSHVEVYYVLAGSSRRLVKIETQSPLAGSN